MTGTAHEPITIQCSVIDAQLIDPTLDELIEEAVDYRIALSGAAGVISSPA
jgi:hypothetical protein